MNKKNILIIEDEATIGIFLECVLFSTGQYAVDIVSSGESAITKAKEKIFDLIIADINLKGSIDGIEAVKKIKESQHPQVIYTSGTSDGETTRRAEGTEPLDFIRKPVDVSVLVSHVKSILGN